MEIPSKIPELKPVMPRHLRELASNVEPQTSPIPEHGVKLHTSTVPR
jgi:hypothetical protein